MSSPQIRQIEALERILSDPNEEPVKLSYPTIETITQEFSQEIGRGGFGVVYLGTLPSGKIAVKKLCGAQDLDDIQFADEINCLIMAKHKNIVRFLGYCADTDGKMIKHKGKYILAGERQRILCFEYIPNGNLYHYLKEKPNKDEWQMRYIMIKEICQGLQCLHGLRINHLDLKPENVLMDTQMRPKITDFGLSRCFDEGQSRIFTKNISGTRGYIAPEVIDNGEISFKSDIFSLGIVIIKLLTGRNNYDTENWDQTLDVQGPQAKSCIEIAQMCTHADQHKRPTVDEILYELNVLESIIQESRKDTWSSLKQVRRAFVETELLDVYPFELNLLFKPSEEISCALSLINRTERQVGFLIIPGLSDRYLDTELLNGIVMPLSTTAITLTMREQEKPLLGTDKLEILMFIMGSESNRNIRKLMSSIDGVVNISADDLVKQAEELGGKVHRTMVMLTVNQSEAKKDEFEFMHTLEEETDTITNITVHPTEPWVLVIKDATCSIWNLQTKEKVSQKSGDFDSAMFVPRKQWLVIGDMDGSIFVCTYPTMEKVKEFHAHDHSVSSLAVHPTQPFVLSASEGLIKLWDWETDYNDGWYCNLIFDEQDFAIDRVIFDPSGNDTFATLGRDKRVKIWTIDSSKPVTTISKAVKGWREVEYVSTETNQNMIATIRGPAMNIWDVVTEKRLHTFFMDSKSDFIMYQRKCGIASFICHPTRPLLVTSSENERICVWNTITYRLEKYVDIPEEDCPGHMEFIGLRSVAIAFGNGIAIIDID